MKHKPVKANEVLKNKEKKNCPRCGDGTYLAKHKDRLFCGKCHYCEFMSSQKS